MTVSVERALRGPPLSLSRGRGAALTCRSVLREQLQLDVGSWNRICAGTLAKGRKAVFYCGGIEEAQGFYKCFMLSRLQFSTGSKKEKKRGSKTRGGGAAALLAGFRARSAPSRPPPAPFSPEQISLCFCLSLSCSLSRYRDLSCVPANCTALHDTGIFITPVKAPYYCTWPFPICCQISSWQPEREPLRAGQLHASLMKHKVSGNTTPRGGQQNRLIN